jgi:hypothetical protein
MQDLQYRYEGTDRVLDHIYEAINFPRFATSNCSSQLRLEHDLMEALKYPEVPVTTAVDDGPIPQPQQDLGIAIVTDYFLSRGIFPDKEDIFEFLPTLHPVVTLPVVDGHASTPGTSEVSTGFVKCILDDYRTVTNDHIQDCHRSQGQDDKRLGTPSPCDAYLDTASSLIATGVIDGMASTTLPCISALSTPPKEQPMPSKDVTCPEVDIAEFFDALERIYPL